MLKMWLKITVLCTCLLIADADVKIINPSISPFMARENFPMNFTCSADLTKENSLFWYRNGSKIESDPTARINITQSVSNNNSSITVSTLYISNMNESGEYRCTEENSLGEKQRDSLVTIKLFSVQSEDDYFAFQKPAKLVCNFTGDASNISWKKGNQTVSQINTGSGNANSQIIEHPNGTLEFINPTRELAGVYTCSFGTGSGTGSATATLYASAFVKPFDKSKNLVQDESLDVICSALGYPIPNITWYKGDQEIKADDKHVILSPDGDVPNAHLHISSVDFADGGTYICMATNEYNSTKFNNSQILLVRVKDKLAALWPFLGIVAEVVVLCTIIFIYEKKRNKDAANEEDVNQDGATAEKKPEGVRHRGNTNNPRA